MQGTFNTNQMGWAAGRSQQTTGCKLLGELSHYLYNFTTNVVPALTQLTLHCIFTSDKESEVPFLLLNKTEFIQAREGEYSSRFLEQDQSDPREESFELPDTTCWTTELKWRLPCTLLPDPATCCFLQGSACTSTQKIDKKKEENQLLLFLALIYVRDLQVHNGT